MQKHSFRNPVLSVKKLEEEYQKKLRIQKNMKKPNVLPIEGFIRRRRDLLVN